MKIVPFKSEHILGLQLQAAQRHVAPFITADYAVMLEGEFAFTALVDDEPIAVAGITRLWDNRGLAWSFLGESAKDHMVALHKVVEDFLDVAPFRRIEADTPCDFKAGHRWLKMLGFKQEAERMVAFRVDGGDSSLYARVKHG